ncbi:PAS domain-containing protein [Croceibacterium ferulae]|uniref:PAS domain-containing protein n=1 Tax=Croceibacterium ferulae TaxID=1854641 RepID=UPI0013906326|nr:PAS domain-containing protein [Croceibacterium ferulae]
MSASTKNAVHVTSADFVRHFGGWQDRASKSPIVVTHHGRARLIVLSPEKFAEMASNDEEHAISDATSRSTDAAGLEILTDSMDECFIAFDTDLRVVQVNAAICAYLRVGRSQLEGRTLAASVPQSNGSLAYANVVCALESGKSATLEVQSIIYPDRWLRVKTFPFSTGSACLFRDVTEEVEARDAVDIQLATRQALVAHGMVGRCVLTVRATFREVDAAFAALVDLEPQGLLRARFCDIFPLNRRAEAREFVESVLETGKAATLDTRLLRRGHAEEEVRLSMAALTGVHDRGVVVIATRK